MISVNLEGAGRRYTWGCAWVDLGERVKVCVEIGVRVRGRASRIVGEGTERDCVRARTFFIVESRVIVRGGPLHIKRASL